MFTQKQSRGSLWMGVAAVFAMTSAVAAQFQGSGSAVLSGASQPSARVSSSASSSGSDDLLIEVIEPTSHDLGSALPGIFGAPEFKFIGLIAPGHRAELMLTNAAPKALAVIFVSLDSAPKAFKGGTLIPAAPAYTTVIMTNSNGAIYISVVNSGSLPAGFDLVMQYAILDAAALQGVALSNALKTSTH